MFVKLKYFSSFNGNFRWDATYTTKKNTMWEIQKEADELFRRKELEKFDMNSFVLVEVPEHPMNVPYLVGVRERH